MTTPTGDPYNNENVLTHREPLYSFTSNRGFASAYGPSEFGPLPQSKASGICVDRDSVLYSLPDAVFAEILYDEPAYRQWRDVKHGQPRGIALVTEGRFAHMGHA